MEHMLTRLQWLVGEEKIKTLQGKKVLLFGCGGVGSFALEALVRSGVGHIVIVDGDQVTVSNINRQLIALPSTVGRRKVEVAKERALAINPNLHIEAYDMVYDYYNTFQ